MIEKINIEIPESIIDRGNHININNDSLKGKTIIGLCGYSKSGKDFVAKEFVKIGFERVSFGDTLKKTMNSLIKQQVFEDLKSKNISVKINEIDFFADQGKAKEILRPYMIWFAETIKEINGANFWVNKSIELSSKDKLVISDVRRENEIEIFTTESAVPMDMIDLYSKALSDVEINKEMSGVIGSLIANQGRRFLVHINKKDNKDEDLLTKKTILLAQEKWLFYDKILMDPKMPPHIWELSAKIQVVKIINNVNKLNIDNNIFKFLELTDGYKNG